MGALQRLEVRRSLCDDRERQEKQQQRHEKQGEAVAAEDAAHRMVSLSCLVDVHPLSVLLTVA